MPDVHRGGAVWFLTASGTSGGGGVQHTVALLQAMSYLYGACLTIIGREELQSVPLPRPAGRYVVVPRRSTWQKVWWLATARGYDLLSPFVDRWLSAAEELPALALLDRSRIGRFAPRLAGMGIPVVTVHHNVEVDYIASTESNVLLRPRLVHVIRKNERMAVHHSSINLAMTREDQERLRDLYGMAEGRATEVLGTFARFDRLSPTTPDVESPDRRPFHVVTTGSLCDAQTVDGVAWFLTEIYPRLKARVPDVMVTVAGRAPTSKVRRLVAQAGVRLVPDPGEMDAVVRHADVYVAPFRLGSGLKLRVSDGLRCGLPVVSHAVSARGYADLLPSPLLQVFRWPDECVAALERVRLAPPDLATRRRIQTLYVQRFSFSAGVARLSAILGTQLDHRAPSPQT